MRPFGRAQEVRRRRGRERIFTLRRAIPSWLPDQTFGGDAQLPVQCPDHLQGQQPLAAGISYTRLARLLDRKLRVVECVAHTTWPAKRACQAEARPIGASR